VAPLRAAVAARPPEGVDVERILGKFSPQVFALLRIVTGFLFLCHGLQKVFGVLGGEKKELLSFMGLGGVIELVGGLLVMIGLQAGWAAFICSGTMAVAYFKFHQGQGALPIQNRGELAALYSWLFLYLATKGSGAWSVDALLRKSPES
jgi:putative oxidoreductase